LICSIQIFQDSCAAFISLSAFSDISQTLNILDASQKYQSTIDVTSIFKISPSFNISHLLGIQ